MKRIRISSFLYVILLLLSAQTLFAQSEEIEIAYGETASGEISNRNFDVIYIFTGERDDIVVINLIRGDSADYDPYLYLTTPDNEIIAQNDDFYNLNSRIIAQLPDDGQYLIVATRRGERSGTGQGAYQLSLDNGRSINLETTMEGRVVVAEAPPTHVFTPETSGSYTIQYNHIRGAYFPSLIVSMIAPDSNYEEDIAQISGRGLQAGELQLVLDSDIIYILTLEQSSYDYSASEGDFALYTLAIQQPE